MPARPQRASLVDPFDGVCEAPVVRTERWYGEHEPPDGEPTEIASFTAHVFRGCERAGFGAIDMPLTLTRIEVDSMPPASPELARLIAPVDQPDEIEGELHSPVSPPRTLVVPDLDLAIIYGQQSWVARGGRLVEHPIGGWPRAIVRSAEHAWLFCESPSEGWYNPLSEYVPRAAR